MKKKRTQTRYFKNERKYGYLLPIIYCCHYDEYQYISMMHYIMRHILFLRSKKIDRNHRYFCLKMLWKYPYDMERHKFFDIEKFLKKTRKAFENDFPENWLDHVNDFCLDNGYPQLGKFTKSDIEREWPFLEKYIRLHSQRQKDYSFLEKEFPEEDYRE